MKLCVDTGAIPKILRVVFSGADLLEGANRHRSKLEQALIRMIGKTCVTLTISVQNGCHEKIMFY